MRGGAKPGVRKLAKGAVLTEQGERGDDIYLLLNGVLSVWVVWPLTLLEFGCHRDRGSSRRR